MAKRIEQFEHDPADQVQQRRASLVNFVRLAFLVTFTVATFLILTELVPIWEPGGAKQLLNLPWTLVTVLLLGGAVLAVDILLPQKRISTLVAILLGLAAGLLATWAFGFLIDLLAQLYGFAGDRNQPNDAVTAVKVLLGVCLVFLCISTVLQTQDDFRLLIPYVEFAKEIRGARPLLLDTSALIDARIVDLGETGLLQAPIVIPAFVVAELQLLADQSDKTKRARGRRGLDVVGRLQRSGKMDVSIDETPIPGKAVDQMLIELARRMPAMVVTTDSGLARVAGIKGVGVINIHELAAALKPSVGPGDALTLRVVKAGEQPGQGVGYLEDGTMVVVEEGRERVGRTVHVSVVSTLQTGAGRLVFAKITGDPEAEGVEPDRAAHADVPHAEQEAADDAGAAGTEPPVERGGAEPQPGSGPGSEPERRRGPFGPGGTRRGGSPRNPRR